MGLGEDDQDCHRIPGLNPQIAHGFDQQARQSSLDTLWALHGVGDFQGPLPRKLQKLVDEIERIYLYNVGHFGRDSANHPKILIYTKWAALVPTILAHLARKRIFASSVTGSTPVEQRSEKFRAFNDEKPHLSDAIVAPSPALNIAGNSSEDTQVYWPQKCRIMVITDVASAGVNLHQANTLFLLDCPWSDSLLAQLVGRVWRIGQRRAVTVYTLVATNTLDPYIVHTRDGKRTFTTSLSDPIHPASVTETAQPEERETEGMESRTTASRRAASQVSLTAIYLQR